MNTPTLRCSLTGCLLCAAVLLLAAAGPSAAFYTDADRAKDLMQAQRYREATDILEKAVKDDQNNPEAFFHLGLCRLRDRDYRGADVHFRRAFSLKPSYGYVIGNEYKGAATALLSRDRYEEARRLFISAAEYQPGLRRVISTDYIDAATVCMARGRFNEAVRLYREATEYRPDARRIIADLTFTMGAEHARSGRYDRADTLFDVTVSFDGMYRKSICDQYRHLGDRADDERCPLLYRRALKYGTWHNDAIGRRLLAIAATRTTEREALRYRQEARLYRSLREDAKLYLPGTYTFTLGPSETIDHWIRLPNTTGGALLFSGDNRFELLFDDGSKYDKSNLESAPGGTMLYSLKPLDKPYYKFKIHAMSQQLRIIMVVQ